MLQHIVGLGDTLGTKGVGLNDIGTSLQIATVDIFHHILAGQAEHIIITLHLDQMRWQLATQFGIPEVILAEAVSLNHCAHCTIEHKNPFLDYIVKSFPHRVNVYKL